MTNSAPEFPPPSFQADSPERPIHEVLAHRERQTRAGVERARVELPQWISATGMRCRLRKIRISDQQALQRAFAKLSPEEIRARFLHPLKTLSDEHARQLAKLRPKRDLAFALICPLRKGEVLAAVRASIQARPRVSASRAARGGAGFPTGVAEFAIVVPQALSGQGLGSWLMQQLLHELRQLNVQHLFGEVLADNRAMLALARKLGFSVERHPDEGSLLRVQRAL